MYLIHGRVFDSVGETYPKAGNQIPNLSVGEPENNLGIPSSLYRSGVMQSRISFGQ